MPLLSVTPLVEPDTETCERPPLSRTATTPRPPHRAGASRVARLTECRPGGGDLLALARELASSATSWLDATRLRTRRWALMAASDKFEAWVIGWPPGGAISLHDHGSSAGALAVAAGELLETKVAKLGLGGVTFERNTLSAGASVAFEEHHIHDVVNVSTRPCISVHVYGPRLTSMTYYRVVDAKIEADHTVYYSEHSEPGSLL
jgi:predicted metal-dependent enzyme (double-stranded beta helix superfamily)